MIATIFLLFFANLTSVLPNLALYVSLPFFVSPVALSKGDMPWNFCGLFSAGV